MTRHINAEHFDERVRLAVGLEGENMTDDFKDGIQATLMLLRTEPTADVQPVVRGEWIEDGAVTKCSICGNSSDYCGTENFCSYCGADMRGGTE